MINVLHSSIEIGLRTPISFLHITDTHLPEYEPGNEKNMRERMLVENMFKEAVEHAEKQGLKIIHTGDIMEFCNEENLKIINNVFADKDYFIAIGNHDFCPEGGRGEDPKNMERNKELLAAYFEKNLYFDAKILNGELNVITLNNAFFQIDSKQIELLKTEVERGLPILLCMHIPLFSPEHAKERRKMGNCAHLMGPSEELLALYEERYQFHRADEVTRKAIDYIKREPLIKGIIAGHTHMNYEETLDGGTVQLVTAKNCDGYARIITIK